MVNRNLLIRLFFSLIFLGVLYSCTRCVAFKLAENVVIEETEVEQEYTTHKYNPPVGMANILSPTPTPKPVVKKSNKKSMGRFKLTGYCACMHCCGKTDGITSTGTKAKAGRTIAVDPSVIPYGSKVIINGKEYVAEDCGGAIKNKKIDIFFNSHEEALEWGVKYAEVYIKVGD
jgi:3D (Asp-Asp-Asp) domain-containing protein